MFFIYINIYLLCCVLNVSYVELNTDFVSISNFTFDVSQLSYSKMSTRIEYLYDYIYSSGNMNVVNFACKAQENVTNPVLKWQISNNDIHTSCKNETANEINYITTLDDMQNGNTLKCILNENKEDKALAQITLLCPDCKAVKNHKLMVNCYEFDDPIKVYLNGTISKGLHRTVELKMGQVQVVHCEIEVDEDYDVDLDTNELSIDAISQIHKFSKSVYVYKIIMTKLLNYKTIRCRKINIHHHFVEVAESTVTFKLISDDPATGLLNSPRNTKPQKAPRNGNGSRTNRSIGNISIKDHCVQIILEHTGSASPKNWITYNASNELVYSDNYTMYLTCIWTGDGFLALKWLKNNIQQAYTDTEKRLKYNISLTREDTGSNVDCQLGIGDKYYTRSIILKYKPKSKPETTTSKIETTTAPVTTTTDQPIEEENIGKEINWITILSGIAAVALILIVIFVICICKPWRSSAPTVNLPEEPVLDPTYSGPVDNINMYDSTYNQKTTQNTYSTPFVPTIDEMYTVPTPKKDKLGIDPLYQMPSKFRYANLQTARQNELDPGYSNLAEDADDNASVTYTYCSLPRYTRPE